jgi:hypothetical protein
MIGNTWTIQSVPLRAYLVITDLGVDKHKDMNL